MDAKTTEGNLRILTSDGLFEDTSTGPPTVASVAIIQVWEMRYARVFPRFSQGCAEMRMLWLFFVE